MKIRRYIHLALLVTLSLLLCSITEAKPQKVKAHEGDSCDKSTFAASCDKNILLRCVKETVKATDCSKGSNDRICVEFKDTSKAKCVSNEDKCYKENDVIIRELTTNTDKAINFKMKCTKTTGGKLYYQLVEDEDLQAEITNAFREKCSKANETVTRCEAIKSGKTFLRTYQCEATPDGLFYKKIDQKRCYDGFGTCSENGECLPPQSCDANFENHCEGDIAKNCKNKRLEQTDCSNFAGKHPRTCAVEDGKAKCIQQDSKCNKEGEERISHCNPNSGFEFHEICTKLENGELFYRRSGSVSCTNGCNEDKTACKVENCSKQDDIKEVCLTSILGITMINKYICKKDSKGKLSWHFESKEKCDNGSGTCSADGKCVPAETCNASNFKPLCEGNVAVNCMGTKVRHQTCSKKTNCTIIDSKAKCMNSSRNTCTNEGEIIPTSCKGGKEYYSECQKGSDGKLYYISAGKKKCAKGCNANGTACEQ